MDKIICNLIWAINFVSIDKRIACWNIANLRVAFQSYAE